MSYYDQLNPWCIIRLLPNMQRTVVSRFRRRNDAEAHLRLLQQMTPAASYTIVFDMVTENLELEAAESIRTR
jgi:hypothetical protein